MSSSIPLKKLFIVGGSGFLGSHICHEAVQSGWKVFSLSRSGKIPSLSASSSPSSTVDSSSSSSHSRRSSLSPHHWVNQVTWIKGDVNDPSSYSKYLDNVTAVIHSVGILFENFPYQNLAQKPLSTLSQYIPNPFSTHQLHQKNENSSFTTTSSTDESFDHHHHKRTYEQVNRDTALTLASTASQYSNIKSFTYISACHHIPPFLPERYISSKIEAENALCSMDQFKTIIFRPGIMYSSERPTSLIGAGSFTLSNAFCYLPMVGNTFPWLSVRPLPVSIVAKAVLQAILKSEQPAMTKRSSSKKNLIFEVDDIAQISEEAY